MAFQESIVTKDYDQIADLLGDGYELHHGAGRTPDDGAGATIAICRPASDHFGLVADLSFQPSRS